MPRPDMGSNWIYGDCRLVVVGWSSSQGLQVDLYHKELFPLSVHIDEGLFNSLVEDGNIKRKAEAKPISGVQTEMIRR